MLRKNQNSLEWLEFELLQNEPVVHVLFTRKLWEDKQPLSYPIKSLPLEKEFFEQALALDRVAFVHQVHGNQLILADSQDLYADADGMMTKTPRVGLAIQHADCQATIFYDPIHHALATVHAGWRGQVKNIYQETALQMAHTFGTRVEDLIVCISPSLGPCHSEFIHFRTELPEEFWSFQTKENYFDLWQIARYQLEQLGILPHHIEIASICTYKEKEDFFSYRRDKIKGRNQTTIAFLK